MTSPLKKWPIFGLLKPEFISNIHMVLVYGESGKLCLIVTKDQTLYALRNSCTCYIKTGGNDDQIIISPKIVDGLCEEKIKTMAYGKGTFVLVLTENGKMYTVGSWTYESDFEINACYCHCSELRNVELDIQDNFVVDISCGNYYSVALTNTGNVYFWGSDHMDESWMQSTMHSKVNTGVFDAQFHSISCGANHCMAVTCNGHVYSWGFNSKGQLGLGDNEIRTDAWVVTHLIGTVIEKVVCGCNHTLALSDKGTLCSWGDNMYGQLGVILQREKMSSTPMLIPHLLRVLDMAASSSADISVAMGIDHQIFMWGNCSGQIITLPTLISVDIIHDAFALYASPRAMHQPFVIDDEEKKEEGDVEIMNIMDHLMAAFDDKTTSDLIIEVQGKPIHVHKAILMIRSKYFKVMFQGDWKENNDSILSICVFSYMAYSAFLKFLYSDKIDEKIPTENVVELLQLADLYDDDHLKASYTGVLTQRISTANTALFYSVAVQYNNSVLRRRCIRFAVTHMTEISKSSSFSELTLETMRNFIIEVGDQGAFKSRRCF